MRPTRLKVTVSRNMPGSTMYIYSQAASSTFAEAPSAKSRMMGCVHRYPPLTKSTPKRIVSSMLLPSIFSAHRTSLRPSTMLMRALEPAPTSEPKAWMIFMMGKVMVSAASSILPSPMLLPRKMRSTIL